MIDALNNTAQAQQRLERDPAHRCSPPPFFADDAQSADATGITVPPAASTPAWGRHEPRVVHVVRELPPQYKASYVSNTVSGKPVTRGHSARTATREGHDGGSGVVSGTPTVICSNSAGTPWRSCAGYDRPQARARRPRPPSGENNGFFKLIGTRRPHDAPSRRRLHGEEGASLLVALAFLLLFAVLLTGSLQFAVTSFTASNAVISRERAAYSAEAAVHTAASRRSGRMPRSGVSGQQCVTQSFSGADLHPRLPRRTCVPRRPTAARCSWVSTVPDNAILTQGGDLTVNGGGNGRLRTNANVFVNGAITVANSTVLDAHDWAVAATGNCSCPSPSGTCPRSTR